MSHSATYRAVLFGPNPIASGTEIELEFEDGAFQEVVVLEAVEDGNVIRRAFRRGETTDEPIPYQFVEEQAATAEGDVPN